MYNRLNSKNARDETSMDDDKNDLMSSSVSRNYGATSAPPGATAGPLYVPTCGLVFYVMAFFGFVGVQLLRESLSVGIVAMVNQTAVSEADVDPMTNESGECPKDAKRLYEDGEFIWDRNQQGIVLAAFYYGYGLIQVPGGLLADRYGGKWLFGGCILVSSVISLLTPTAARIDIGLLIALRVLSGVIEGVMLPAIHALLARWSAPQYRSVIVSIIFVGTDVGITVGTLLTGVLCDYGFAGGWPSAFYIFGAVVCGWAVAWCLLCHDTPSEHPRISAAELEYWDRVIGTSDLVGRPPTPWRRIIASVPVWALSVAYFANNWGFFTMMTCLPLFMHDVLGLDMTRNGLFSALPFFTSICMVVANGVLADWLRMPGRLSTNFVRKLFCVVGFTLTGGFMILTGYVGCNRVIAELSVHIVMSCAAIGFTSVGVTQLDMAPLHAGKLMGLTYTVANLGSIAAPHAVGALTNERSTRSEWQNVFFLAAAVYFIGAVVFAVFGSGHRQSWADSDYSAHQNNDQHELRHTAGVDKQHTDSQ